jgi:hypothetical protein
VPRYAVNGPIEVIEPDGVALASAQTFIVNNYRNTFAFSFSNFTFNIDWNNVKGEFGGNQVDFTFFGNDTGIPNPFALLFWGISAAALNGKGACFGMALTSVLLSEYEPSQINASNGLPNGAAPIVYNLQRNNSLDEMIEQNHLAQFSSEIINAYGNWQLSAHSAASVYNQINNALLAGDHPIISMQAGANHAVVPYDLEPGPKGNGDYYIDVYDSNRPFNGDGSEITSITDHASIEGVSRIYIDPAAGWSFTMADNSTHSGGYGTLQVYTASLVANGVTMPLSLNGLGNIIFGANVSTVLGDFTLPAIGDTSAPAHNRLLSDDLALQRALAEAGNSRHVSIASLASGNDETAYSWHAVNPQPLPPGVGDAWSSVW